MYSNRAGTKSKVGEQKRRAKGRHGRDGHVGVGNTLQRVVVELMSTLSAAVGDRGKGSLRRDVRKDRTLG